MAEFDFSNMDFHDNPRQSPTPNRRQLDLSSMEEKPSWSIAKWFGERTWDKLTDLLSPKNDHFVNTLKANGTDSVNYLFNILKTPGWAVPRLLVALAGGYGLYTTGQFEIDHQVASYAEEKRRIFYMDFFNIILSVLNSTEAVLDFADHWARHKFIQQASADPRLGPNHRKVKSAKNRLFLKQVWDYSTTLAMIVAHILFPHNKLEINMIYQASEIFIESPFFGTSVWHYLSSLKKNQPFFLWVVLLSSLFFYGLKVTGDIDGLAKMSINLNKMASNPVPDIMYMPEGSNATQDFFYYRWDSPKTPWNTKERLKPNPQWMNVLRSRFTGNYYGATILRQDVIREEENGDVLTLYTIRTHTGREQRVLTYWVYDQETVALLTAKQLIWFVVTPAMFDEEPLSSFPTHIFIPREEQGRIVNSRF